MGARYSLKLYFPYEHAQDVFRALAAMSDYPPDKKKIIVTFDDREIEVPFTTRIDSGRTMTMRHQDPSLRFDIALIFTADAAILDYIDPHLGIQLGEPAPIGYFYMTVRLGNRYSCFEIHAATKAMGHLFVKSPSVVQQFLTLLRQHEGLFGIIDLDDDTTMTGWPLLGDPSKSIHDRTYAYVDEEVERIREQLNSQADAPTAPT